MNWEEFNVLLDPGVTKDTPIYKYMPLDYVIIMLLNKKLRLGKIATWEDPYENPILKQRLWRNNNGIKETLDLSTVLDNIYGQSWTLLEESDAMWRIYSHDKQAVRIKTTIGKLFDAIYNPNSNDSLCTFVGCIKYNDKVIDYLTKSRSNKSIIEAFLKNTPAFRDMLLYKREAFKHEQEVRFYYVNPRIWYNTCSDIPSSIGEFKEYDIDFNNLFEEVCFDPRLDNTLYESRRMSLINMGCSADSITKSNLYKLENFEIEVRTFPEDFFEQMQKIASDIAEKMRNNPGKSLYDLIEEEKGM